MEILHCDHTLLGFIRYAGWIAVIVIALLLTAFAVYCCVIAWQNRKANRIEHAKRHERLERTCYNKGFGDGWRGGKRLNDPNPDTRGQTGEEFYGSTSRPPTL